MEDSTGVLDGGVGNYLDQSFSRVIISETRPVEPKTIEFDNPNCLSFSEYYTERRPYKIMEKALPFDRGR